MGNIFDLDSPATLSGFARRVPGPVRRLDAFATPGGTLILRWKPPAGGAVISSYCIERTREGRDYEWLGETAKTEFFVYAALLGEPWFYRVRAFNSRGAGGFRLVYFFRRADRFITGGHNRKDWVLPIVAKPGLRVALWE